jgi:eukaryotic-like serine/threonine-protein kinase
MFSSAEPAVAPPQTATPVPAPAAAVPAPPAAAPGVEAQLQRIQSLYTPKDPFLRRAVGSSAEAPVGVRGAPAGARDPFVSRSIGTPEQAVGIASGAGVRDPFAPPVVPAPPVAPTPPAPAPAPAPAPTRLRGYTIVIASVPVRSGERAAVDVAAAARARGVKGVGVLRSSEYATLRPGYFAVYSQVFETRAEAQRAVSEARSHGYPKAYVRPLGR